MILINHRQLLFSGVQSLLRTLQVFYGAIRDGGGQLTSFVKKKNQLLCFWHRIIHENMLMSRNLVGLALSVEY